MLFTQVYICRYAFVNAMSRREEPRWGITKLCEGLHKSAVDMTPTVSRRPPPYVRGTPHID